MAYRKNRPKTGLAAIPWTIISAILTDLSSVLCVAVYSAFIILIAYGAVLAAHRLVGNVIHLPGTYAILLGILIAFYCLIFVTNCCDYYIAGRIFVLTGRGRRDSAKPSLSFSHMLYMTSYLSLITLISIIVIILFSSVIDSIFKQRPVLRTFSNLFVARSTLPIGLVMSAALLVSISSGESSPRAVIKYAAKALGEKVSERASHFFRMSGVISLLLFVMVIAAFGLNSIYFHCPIEQVFVVVGVLFCVFSTFARLQVNLALLHDITIGDSQ